MHESPKEQGGWIRSGPLARNEERLAATLRAICRTVLGATAIILAVAYSLFPEAPDPAGLYIVLADMLAVFASLRLVQRGALRAASAVLVGMIWWSTTASLVFGGELSSSVFSFYAVAIVAAGLLLGQRAAVLVVLLSIASGFGIEFAIQQGLVNFDPLVSAEASSAWLGATLFLIVGGLVHISVAQIREGYAEADRSEAALEARNRELEHTIREMQRAQEAESLLMQAMDRTGEAVVFFGGDGKVQYANASFERLTGLDAAKLQEMAAESIFEIEDPDLRSEVQEIVVEGKPWRGRFAARSPRGKLIRVDAVLAPFFDEDGTFRVVIGVMRDVTREVELETEISQSQKLEALGRLAGGVAHDFNNLLVVMQGYAEILARSYRDDPEVRDSAEQIGKAARQASELTQQLLAFGRRQARSAQVTDLNARVRDASGMLSRLIPENVNIALDLQPDLWRVFVDPAQVHQILMNLTANSRDAMPEGGNIVVRTQNVPGATQDDVDHVELLVIDDGAGMDEATSEKVFEPFFTTKKINEGTGLGLASVYGIVEQCEGTIRVDSRLGVGTSIAIRLPRCLERAGEEKDAARERAVTSASARILVVEDQEAILRLMTRLLEGEGFEVLTARDGVEALERVEQCDEDIDVLLTDVMMPRLDGPGLAERLRARWPEMGVIFTSGYSPANDLAGEPDDPTVVFLAKPFANDELIEKLRGVLASR